MQPHTMNNNQLHPLKDFPSTTALAISILSLAPSLACSAVVSYLASLCAGGFPATETVSWLGMGNRPLGSVSLTVWEPSSPCGTGWHVTNAQILFHKHTRWHCDTDGVRAWHWQRGAIIQDQIIGSCWISRFNWPPHRDTPLFTEATRLGPNINTSCK